MTSRKVSLALLMLVGSLETRAALPAVLTGPIVNADNGHSYYLLDGASWTDAEAKAQNMGGHLATIRSQAEMDFLYANFSHFGGIDRELWIGLHDLDRLINATDAAVRKAEFLWASGETVAYDNWNPGEPNVGFGEEFFGNVWRQDGNPGYSGKWNNLADVNEFHPYGVVEVPPPTAPFAHSDSLRRRPGRSAKISIAELIANDADPNADPLTVTLPSGTTSNGATVTLEGGWVRYSGPPNNNADSFNYTLTDSTGRSTTGTVSVTVVAEFEPNNLATRNQLSLAVDATGVTLRYAGIPGVSYTLQHSSTLPPNWITLATISAGPDGLFEYRDILRPVSGFYRTVAP